MVSDWKETGTRRLAYKLIDEYYIVFHDWFIQLIASFTLSRRLI